MHAYWQAILSFDRNIRLYLLWWALTCVGYFAIFAVLFNLYLLRLGYGPDFVGMVVGTGLLCSAAFALPAGACGRRWGMRRMIAIGTFGTCAAFMLLPLAEFIPGPARSVWIVILYSALWLGSDLFIVNGPPFLMAYSSPEGRAAVFSMVEAMPPLAAVLFSSIAGVMPALFAALLKVPADRPSVYGYPLWILVILNLVAGWVILHADEPDGRLVQDPAAGAVPNGSVPRAAASTIALIAAVVFLAATSDWTARTFFNVYLDGALKVPTAQIGVLQSLTQILPIFAALAAPLLMARLGAGRTYASALLVLALSMLPLALIQNWAAAALGLMGVLAAISIANSSRTVYSQSAVAPTQRGTMAGASFLASGLSSSLMVFSGGYIIVALGYQTLFLIGAALTLVAFFLFLGVYLYLKRKTSRPHLPTGEMVLAAQTSKPPIDPPFEAGIARKQ